MDTSTNFDRPVQRPARPTLRAGLVRARDALQWRLLLWWALLTLLPTLVAALPVWQLLSGSLDHAPAAAQLAERLDMLAIADLKLAIHERHGLALASGAGVALALTLLLSPLLTAMTAAAARAPERLGFAALLAAGAHDYPRMLRMLVWAAVPLALVVLASGAAAHLAGQAAETAILESDADRAARLALLACAALALLVHATIDAGRAVLAADRRRRSAVLAWLAGCRLLLRRPLAVLGLYVAITVAGLAVAGLVLLARLHVPALGAASTIAAVALAQLSAAVLGWMRAARLFALVELAHAA